MNKKYIECVNEIKKMKNFTIDDTKVNILFSAYDGVQGQIYINDNINNIPFAYEKDGSISYLYSSFKYINTTKDWIIKNVEAKIKKIIEYLLIIDEMGEDISYINFVTL